VEQTRDEAGQVTSVQINAMGWTTSSTDGRSYTTTFTLNNVGKRLSLTNARNKTTTWTLDGIHRPTKVTYPDGTTEEWTFNADGQVATRKDGRGNVISHTYDTVGRQTGTDYPTGTDVSQTYLANDAPASLTDHTGTYATTYDARGAVTQSTSPQGTLEYLYSATGQRTSMSRPGLGATGYVYDDAGRLSSLTNRFAETTTLTRDTSGRVTQQVQANGTKLLLGYDPARGWLTSMEHRRANDTVLARYEYTRNGVGCATRVVAVGDYQVDYTLDNAYQLTRELRTGSVPYDISYTYDPVGNRTGKTVGGVTESATFGDNNQCLTAGGKSFQYDDNGNLAQKTEGGLTTTYTWGYENELLGIAYGGGASNSFTTNRQAHRVGRTDSQGSTNALFDGDFLIADTRADYTWGGAGGLISERAGTTSRWHHPDATFGTRGLTDSAQNVTDGLDYDAFGCPVRTTGTSVTPFRHKGGGTYQTDPDSGLQLLGRRYYDRSLGRFISRDPLGYQAGDINLYRYGFNNPVNASDPSGMFVETALDIIGLAMDVYEFVHQPSWENAMWVGLGVAALVIPVMPSFSVVRRLMTRVEAVKLSKTGCFPAGTPVLLADGSKKPIERIRVGDRVRTADEHSGDAGSGKVVRTFRREHDTLLTIRTEDGKEIQATPEHPFYVEGRGFVTARRLARSDLLTDSEGRVSPVVSITERKGRFAVYNLEVEGTHTYYAGEAGWWVHNIECSQVAIDAWRNDPSIGRPHVIFLPGEGWMDNKVGTMPWGHHVANITPDGIVTDTFKSEPTDLTKFSGLRTEDYLGHIGNRPPSHYRVLPLTDEMISTVDQLGYLPEGMFNPF
jgi:RHS repeat-associated protein